MEKSSITVLSQVFLYYKVTHTAIKSEFFKPVDFFDLSVNKLLLFPTARTTRRRNLMLVVGNKISVLGAYILPVKSCGFFQGILKAKVL